ncbi:MAG TPA: hypothetical protein VHF24_02490, partial [Acidimicrobiales bacterium]|nr:hypothetical protein [Acidimicrobiales bacterium]
MAAASSAGRTLAPAEVLGPGGARVVDLLDRIAVRALEPAALPVAELARRTPAGTVNLPLAVVGAGTAAHVADQVDRSWMAAVERRRSAPRSRLAAAGRGLELEAALNLAMLVGTGPVEDDGLQLEARVFSGARLWLLGGAVAWALAGGEDPFSSWAELVSFGLWPVGPVGDRLVLGVPMASSVELTTTRVVN